ncbi:hypothetical protein BS055_RS14850 [Vibrio parahaemolyticus]|uniref:hypothetical protein n=1 Tax=Vibrio TaxID=662 RepID=UPI0003DFB629|nr:MULTISPECIES: hypothetical protein [Vibrio]EGQ7751991.1 hypothetical protein [Vibrio parahaemolyticus]EGQ7811243.1 hypothetical protein [Vibrio parahaemolyticus]EGQ8538987.1 hypothetical protein [Vibrio parahaemolyticus]EGQ9095697.1 hypothetical protein [Vibrio alginolyticus]EGQ9814393.1 hypothetical protein [Vibrio parahaemolyticus]
MPQEGELGYYNPNTGSSAAPATTAPTASVKSDNLSNMMVNASGNPEYIYANLTRKQYEDYLKRFQQYENQLIDLAMTDKLLNKQLDRNNANATKNLEQANINAANATRKYGLGDLRTDQQKRNLEMNNALALASTNNNTRQAINDLQVGLMTGVSSGSRNLINSVGGV